jgi:hypothetical protein
MNVILHGHSEAIRGCMKVIQILVDSPNQLLETPALDRKGPRTADVVLYSTVSYEFEVQSYVRPRSLGNRVFSGLRRAFGSGGGEYGRIVGADSYWEQRSDRA